MAINKLSNVQIAIVVVPRSVRWPASDASVSWTTAHQCVGALRALVRKVDLACAEAEEDSKLSGGGIHRRRAEICDQALNKLVNFRPFEIAEKALTENIGALERLSDRNSEQAQALEKLKQALTDLREGIPATQRMLQERCKACGGVFV